MNEKIKELYKQSINDADHIYYPGDIPDVFVEKFVELIVKECIQTIQMGITRDGHDTEKYLRSMKHIKQIKEHFGVEL